MAVIYWIHKDKNEDYLKDGYIGISVNLTNRLKMHKSKPCNIHFKNAINKYGWDNLIKEIIFEGTEEEVKVFEEYLRPTEQIGWNLVCGGGMPPSHKGLKRSEETKLKLSIAGKGKHNHYGEKNPMFGRKQSEESNRKNSESNKGKQAGVNNANSKFYHLKDDIIADINKGIERRFILEKYGMSKTQYQRYRNEYK